MRDPLKIDNGVSAYAKKQGKAYEKAMLMKSYEPELAKMEEATARIEKYGKIAEDDAAAGRASSMKVIKEYDKATADRDLAGKRARDIQRLTGTAGDWGPMETDMNQPSPSVKKMLKAKKGSK